MAYSVTPLIGTDFNNTAATSGPLGLQAFGSDGKRYVLAQANATINANDADCAINTTSFLVAASGGAYLSPPVALASGDVAWFGKASV